MPAIAIIGASKDREKYGNKAVRAYQRAGWDVYPVNPNEQEVEGLHCYPSLAETPPVDTVTLYIPAKIGETMVEAMRAKGITQAYVNPGAESDELLKKLKDAGIQALQACSIRMIGEDEALL